MTTVLLVLALFAAIGLSGAMVHQHLTTRQLQRDLGEFRQTYPWLRGWDAGHGNYNYVSVDGGQHWAETVREENGWRIVGPADMTHVRQIQGLQRLSDHVQEHGPINPTTSENAALFNGAGFTIERKEG